VRYYDTCTRQRETGGRAKLGASVREYVFFVFSDFKKHDFLRFFEMTLKKRKKSVAKILSSMMLTLLQKRKKFVECL